MKALVFGLVLMFCWVQQAWSKPTLVIGKLAFESEETILEKWQPLINQLNEKLDLIQIELRPLNYQQLVSSISRREIDFVFTNSASYIEISHAHGLSSPLVSLINAERGQAIRGFGGVILVKQSRTDLLALDDLKGQTIAAPSKQSLGGYMMQLYELMQHGIDAESFKLVETDMPHDRAIQAVLDNTADAAFVRTGVIESLIENKLIQPDTLRVLHEQALPGFPYALSTRLYPEWPIAAMPHVEDEYAGQLAGALLALPYNTALMRQAGIYGFSVPADYEPVRELMRALALPPYHVKTQISWQDIWHSHRVEVLALSALVLVIVLLSVILLWFNRRLKQSVSNLQRNEDDLRIAAVAFETQEAILITDANEKIIRVNHAFTEITGYQPQEVIGQTPRILKSDVQDKAFFETMWDGLLHHGGWSGEIWNRRKNGEIYPEHQVITTIRNKNGEITHYLSTFSDITLRKLNEEKIHQLAFYDPLTGLANRRLLEDHIELALSSNKRYYYHCALLFIDLDHFKNLNDTLGHKLGDELLKQVAARLKSCVREGDTVARPGGDEFIILLQGLSFEKSEAITQTRFIAEKILSLFRQPFLLSESQYVLTASIGINLFFDQHESAEELMKRSDLAMYQAKAAGRNALRFFDPTMQEAAAKRSELEADLRSAIEKSEFLLFYQPKVDYKGHIHGYEALIRWHHPQKGMIAPIDFIPVAEETGLILQIGDWVIQAACQTLAYWQQHDEYQHLTLAINISERQFRQEDFVDRLNYWLEEFNIDCSKLELELTESLLMENIEDCIIKMKTLRDKGVHFALDDFGTGYSSLSYLKNLPLSCLKVDQSFVRDMLVDANDAAIVQTIIGLAKTLDLKVIAEGVETSEQSQALTDLGCELLQGYYYGRPLPIEFKS